MWNKYKWKKWNKQQEKSRRFKNIIVNETSQHETINILNGLRKEYEQFYKIKYDENTIKKIVYSSTYFHNLNNPDKSIDIMDECGISAIKKKQSIVNDKILKKVIYNGLGINIKKTIHYMNSKKKW